jgi:hypothetical protein
MLPVLRLYAADAISVVAKQEAVPVHGLLRPVATRPRVTRKRLRQCLEEEPLGRRRVALDRRGKSMPWA